MVGSKDHIIFESQKNPQKKKQVEKNDDDCLPDFFMILFYDYYKLLIVIKKLLDYYCIFLIGLFYQKNPKIQRLMFIPHQFLESHFSLTKKNPQKIQIS